MWSRHITCAQTKNLLAIPLKEGKLVKSNPKQFEVYCKLHRREVQAKMEREATDSPMYALFAPPYTGSIAPRFSFVVVVWRAKCVALSSLPSPLQV